MRESILRDYLYDHPEVLFESTVVRKSREFCIDGKFIDLLFEVENIHYIVELKRDTITREAVGQIVEYYGRLRQANPSRMYRMILVAPTIAKYRSIPLEEFGIRCVEVPFPELAQDSDEPLLRAASKIRLASAPNRETAFDEVAPDSVASLSYNNFLPPTDKTSLRISHRLLHDAIPAIESSYPSFEIMPIRMTRTNSADIICIPSADHAQNLRFHRGGIWWAFAFGQSEQMAKNDTPNISVIAMPAGLDVTINAELRTSQKALIDRVKRDPAMFSKLVAQHGHLNLQMWLKLEHQPRFYYWAQLTSLPAEQLNAETLLSAYDNALIGYDGLRELWIAKIADNHLEISPKQMAHMTSQNRNLNLAIRLVKTLEKADPIWDQPYKQQCLNFDREYESLRPLIEFFN
jgi:hypothetical protein